MSYSLELPAGQAAVLDAYLSAYAPASEYDRESVMLLNSADICRELEDMADFDINAVTERMVALGYSYHFDRDDSIDGWMMKKI